MSEAIVALQNAVTEATANLDSLEAKLVELNGAETKDKEAIAAVRKEITEAKKAVKAAERAVAKEQKAAEKEAAKAAKQAEKEASRTRVQNDVREPKADTICGQIWAMATEISENLGQPAPISMVLKEAAKFELATATVKTQYARWRKFHGVEGRVTAPVTETATEEAAA